MKINEVLCQHINKEGIWGGGRGEGKTLYHETENIRVELF